MKKSILTAAFLISLFAISNSAVNLPWISANIDSERGFDSKQKELLISTTLVINEIDYDQVGTDTAEFVEIKNVSASPINLDNYTVELINGSGGGAVLYDTIDLPNVNLAAGDYYVICANAATVPNCDLDDLPDTDWIQNGAPDAVGLRLSGVLIDAVSYEGNTGAPYTETAGVLVAAADSNTIALIGISRFADGVDTDNNSVDLSLRCISPGTSNLVTTAGCLVPTANRVVDNTTDNIALIACTTFLPDDCSLRGANLVSNDGDTISFSIPGTDPGCPGGVCTITLGGTELAINDDLAINGPGANLLIVSGNNLSRVFYIAPGNTVTLDALTIANGTVSGSFPTGSGGGIFNDEATLTVSNSVVRNNTSTTGFGGGIFNDSGTLTVNRTTISSNTSSSESGGGIVNRDTSVVAATLNVNNSTVSGNSSFSGGGISNESDNTSATLRITNSTISGNSAAGAGGIFNFGESVGAAILIVNNSTISSNSASIRGGGFSNVQSSGTATATLSSTIVSDNSAPTGPDIDNMGGTLTGSYNLVETITGYTFSSGTNNIFGVDPILGPLQNNGGPTFTHLPLAGGPGHDQGCAFGSTLDQRGFVRTFDWPNVANAPCTNPLENGTDIGATEILAPTAANVAVSGRVLTPEGRGLSNAVVMMSDSQGNARVTRTSSFGYFRFDDVTVGESYIVAVQSKRYQFVPRVINVNDELTDVDFIANQ